MAQQWVVVRALLPEVWGLPSQTQIAMKTSFSTLRVSSIMSMLLKKVC